MTPLPAAVPRASWVPMAIIAMGQAQRSLNVNALPVSIGGIVVDFDVPATAVGTAIVAHSVAVAGFTMPGARLGQKFGSLAVFRTATVVLLAAMALMAFSANVAAMVAAQVDFNGASFVSNARLKDVMAGTTATPEQIEEAVRINADARLRALKLSFLLLAGIALLMISPAGRLPDYLRGAGGTGPVKGA